MKTTRFFIVFGFLLAFVVCASAQNLEIPGIPLLKPVKVKNIKLGDSTPNELEGYKFFSEGKLNKLRLGVSTKADVRNILGTPRQEFYNNDLYDYDSNWLVQFLYFDEKKSIKIRGHFKNNNLVNTKLVPSAEYIGKIYLIILIPKKVISFSQMTFPAEFSKQSSSISAYYPLEKKKFISYDFYQDSYGLNYKIFNKVLYSNLEKEESRHQGDLMSIEYKIPYELEEKIFVATEEKIIEQK